MSGQAPDFRLFLELSPVAQEHIAQRDREIAEALQKFEALAGFSRGVVRMHKKVEGLRQESSPELLFDLKERARLAISFLDVRAETFLGLVSTLEMQNAFIVMLQEFGRTAWKEYIGFPFPPEVMQPEGSHSEHVYQGISDRIQYWATKGYKRVANKENARISHAHPERASGRRPSAAEDQTASVHSTEAGRPSVALGTAGQAKRSPTGGLFAPAPAQNKAGTNAPEAQGPNENHKGKKPVRRNEKYERIDKALRELAAARPKSHEEVFRLLDDRTVAVPNRRPFKAARGWLKGFQQNRHSASAWLSHAWGTLGLPAFPRGPKK